MHNDGTDYMEANQLQLSKYLELRQITMAQAAKELGTNRSTVYRWCSGTVPRSDEMTRIRDWSNGAVMANDFFYQEKVN